MIDEDDEEFLLILSVVLVLLAVVVLVYAFFLLTLHRALGRCRPHNRTMEPGLVWLNLIPLFNLVWQFVTVSRVSASLATEFRARGRDHNKGDYGYALGMTAFALFLAVIVPILGVLCWIGGFVCWVIYWGQIAHLGAQLASPPDYDDYNADEDDYDIPRARSS